jgi:hypothetical protein
MSGAAEESQENPQPGCQLPSQILGINLSKFWALIVQNFGH